MKRIFFLAACLFSFSALFAQQDTNKQGWHLLDNEKDGYMGISLNKAYGLLKGRKAKTVIVAVIDSGIDTLHEDLRPVLWINEKEINGNGMDDDGNGYIDDIYGWNFCGSKKGENLTRNTYEVTRVYHNWFKEFDGKKEKSISADKKFLFSQWKKAEKLINDDYEEVKKNLGNMTRFLSELESSSKIICGHLAVSEFTVNTAKKLATTNSEKISKASSFWVNVFSQTTDTSVKNTTVISDVSDYKNNLENKKKRKEDTPEDTRGILTNDNYTDINDKLYGNNNLKEGSGNHGTSVAGTIAAVRNNGIGIDGIADHVKIMAIRAAPGGDEHDKDVALAIRYAVDNGASVINMSFGKPVSPYKQFVDDAVKYAASKGVLLVHGAGNDGKDISKDIFYPNAVLLDGSKADNFISVGASGDKKSGGYVASFSNYSKSDVDVFAPGVFIYTTTNGNGYGGADGTSLAAPVVSGVAALLKSYFPELTPSQIIEIIKSSGTSIVEEVTLPGDQKTKVEFSKLSSSGKIINAFGAVKVAIAMTDH